MRLGQKGAVDCQRTTVHLEYSPLRLDVDRQAGRGEEVVQGTMTTSEVSRASVREVHMRVAKDLRVQCAGADTGRVLT